MLQVLSIIAYLCIELSPLCVMATANYFKFVTMGAFVATIVLYVLLILKIPQRCLRCNCVNWPLVVSNDFLKRPVLFVIT